MSYIAEFAISTPFMTQTLSAVPEMVLETEDLRSLPSGAWIYVFWAGGDDLEAFEAEMGRDSTVEGYTALTELDDRALYRVTLAEAGGDNVTTPLAAKHDIFFLSVKASRRWTRFRARVPTRQALFEHRDDCLERGLDFRLHQLFREERLGGNGRGGYGLTPIQRTTLRRALTAGYFEVPRETTLRELADEFDVSEQAVSGRLRRGLRTLLDHTVRG